MFLCRLLPSISMPLLLTFIMLPLFLPAVMFIYHICAKMCISFPLCAIPMSWPASRSSAGQLPTLMSSNSLSIPSPLPWPSSNYSRPCSSLLTRTHTATIALACFVSFSIVIPIIFQNTARCWPLRFFSPPLWPLQPALYPRAL